MPTFLRNPRGASYSLQGSESPATLIFAEGDAEASFLENWLMQNPCDPKNIAIVLVRGDTNKLALLLGNLFQEENFSSVTAFGFFYDAEKDSATRTVKSIENLLRKHHVIPPRATLSVGVQIVADKKIAIYVSPDNASPGWIEDIVTQEIASTDLANCMNEFANLVGKATNAKVHSKTIAQAFLGIRKPGLCGTSHGFNRGFLDVMHPTYKGIRDVFGSLL